MTTTSSVHPDEVFKALIEKGNRRDKSEKLRRIHELCSLEYSRHSHGARDLSLSNMSKVAESHGLFKARTIYNAQSSDYVTVINAWADYNGPRASTLIGKKTALAEKYEFLRKIEDPAVRSLCQMGLIERDKVRAELNMLKSKFELIVDMRPFGAGIAKGAASAAVIEPEAQLTDSERNALLAAIDTKSLAQRHWQLGETGEVLDQQGRFVFRPGFATAIAKILGKAHPSSDSGVRKKL